jgi:MoaA/NifB/PqqE/SkfB family radical SAM enzyme/esterase/lipase
MPVGIILIHGYTGSSGNLKPLARKLAVNFGNDSVKSICLPGHSTSDTPLFDEPKFLDCIKAAVDFYNKERRKIVLICHSTGGVLALSFILKYLFAPYLLILASTPKRIDISYMERWKKHRTGRGEIPFSSIAKMVSLINYVGAQRFNKKYPVIILHGGQDELVTLQEADQWRKNSFNKSARLVIIPSAGHDIFCGTYSVPAIDLILRAVSDIAVPFEKQDRKIINTLTTVEPELKKFLAVSPASKRHLSQCASGQTAFDKKPSLLPFSGNEPVFANVEITTRCNLRCRYCARSMINRQALEMPREMFSRILDMLPHAYRITLVGLGEPLLHPHIVDIVADASSRKRRVALVTNAMLLDKALSRELIKAGLHSIAFSLDAPDQETASQVRQGTDFQKAIDNIREFTGFAGSKRNFSTAVFTAVSAGTVQHLPQLIDLVAQLGVKVMMLTDLNFRQNTKYTLWKNVDDNISRTVRSAAVHAFSKKLPLLSVHGLEEFGLARRYRDFLLLPPDKLYNRSPNHTYCFSPWQTVPVDVHGNVTVCDCQPENVAGNLLTEPFSGIWNGKKMSGYRRRMLGDNPPGTCRICPRF